MGTKSWSNAVVPSFKIEPEFSERLIVNHSSCVLFCSAPAHTSESDALDVSACDYPATLLGFVAPGASPPAPRRDFLNVQIFKNIVVMPTQHLRVGTGKAVKRDRQGIYRGGPLWPAFAFQLRARHCRGLIPLPHDSKPVFEGEPSRYIESGIWCGPISDHFGHMIADFGMRIAEAAHRIADVPLVFSIGPDRAAAPPAFFQFILAQLRVPESRVLLIREPARFGTLHVPAQAERHFGPGPSSAHLDLMDAITASHGSVRQDIDHLFVSRSLFPDGRFAAERYLDEVLDRAGATVLHPETHDLASQLAYYRRARTIVFSEGSAIHALQLLGRLQAEIVILVRRPGTRLARKSLTPRVRNLSYWDFTSGFIYSRSVFGKRQMNRALSLIDDARLLANFKAIGLDIAEHWDCATYRVRRDADIESWIAYMRQWNLHPAAPKTIQKCLRRAGIAIDVQENWPRPALTA